jgi:sugar phosphate isomerase/epimerase
MKNPIRNTISFMGANFVAREIGWHMPGGWMQGENASVAWFSPVETFAGRFDALLKTVKALGFDAFDVWNGHLHWSWATDRHLSEARGLLDKHGFTVPSLAGHFGDTLENLRSACRVAQAVGAPVLGGVTQLLSSQRAGMVAVLREHGLRLGVENHEDKSARELLHRLGPGDEDVIGAALDTGWLATNGAEVAKTVDELAPRIFHLHLKDIKARRKEKTGFQMIDQGHENCRPGSGIVPVAECLRVLMRRGYRGAISIEHEPETFDPTEDCRAGLLLVRQILEQTS